VTAPVVAALAEQIAALPVPVVFGHMSPARAADGVDQPGFAALRAPLRDGAGRCWAELSGAYRVSAAPAGSADSLPFARALYEANPQRVVWRSDWPHTGERVDATKGVAGRVSFRDLDLGALLELLAASLPDAVATRRVLVDNPAVLYGFASEGSCAWT
jgi:predicted TIM-barrel fold metal-dependent hydrolase